MHYTVVQFMNTTSFSPPPSKESMDRLKREPVLALLTPINLPFLLTIFIIKTNDLRPKPTLLLPLLLRVYNDLRMRMRMRVFNINTESDLHQRRSVGWCCWASW